MVICSYVFFFQILKIYNTVTWGYVRVTYRYVRVTYRYVRFGGCFLSCTVKLYLNSIIRLINVHFLIHRLIDFDDY